MSMTFLRQLRGVGMKHYVDATNLSLTSEGVSDLKGGRANEWRWESVKVGEEEAECE